MITPTVLGALWGDALGGFLYGGYVTRILIWHSTWSINSLAHMFGDQDFSTENTSRGNLFLALITHGEGHHNYHHEFPRDYRNGISSLDWDPTKWLINLGAFFGLCTNLITVSPSDIAKGNLILYSSY